MIKQKNNSKNKLFIIQCISAIIKLVTDLIYLIL